MAIFHCTACDIKETVADKFLGKKVRCPQCREIIEVTPQESLEALAKHSAPYAEEHIPFTYGGLLGNISAGLFTGLFSWIVCIALAVLILPDGWKQGYFPLILDVLLVSSIIGFLLTPLRSRVHFGLLAPSPSVAAVLFILLHALFAAMPKAEEAVLLTTALSCTILVSLAVGVLAWFTRISGSSNWVRFIPIQIFGGVLAGLGLLILGVGIKSITGVLPHIAKFVPGMVYAPNILESNIPLVWLPAVILALILFVFFYTLHRPIWGIIAVFVACAIAPFVQFIGLDVFLQLSYGMGRFSHTLDTSRYILFYSGDFWGQIDWNALYAIRGEIVAGVLLLLSMALYKITLVESEASQNIQLDQELKVLGANNMLSALSCGVPLSFCLARSLGNYYSGGRGALSIILAGLVLIPLLLFASPLYKFIPAFVPAGVLLFFALKLLYQWLVVVRKDFFKGEDYYLLLLSFVFTVSMGLTVGVGLAFALIMMISVTRHGASGGVLKQIFHGANHSSTVDRAPAQRAHLKQHGDSVLVFRLQGFVTVGALYGIIRQSKQKAQAISQESVPSFIYDFSAVQRFGASMHQGFEQLYAFGEEYGVNIILTHISLEMADFLETLELVSSEPKHGLKIFQNLDYALEWAENRLLEEANLLEMEKQSLAKILAPVFPVKEYIPALMKVLEPFKFKAGEYIFQQGDASDSMYFIESGMCRIELQLDGGKTLRLKKMGPGAIFGEMGLYMDAPRSAGVVATTDVLVFRLSQRRVALVEEKMPKLKSAIDHYLVNLLASRIANANAMISDLMC